jgi:hypothetical protein
VADGAREPDQSPDHEAARRRGEDDEGHRRRELPEEERHSDRVPILKGHDGNGHSYDGQDD